MVALAVSIAAIVVGCAGKKSDVSGRTEPDAKKRASKLYRQGKYDISIDQLKTYLIENPGDYEAQVLLASAYIVTGRTPEAYREAKKAYDMKKSLDVGYQLALLADKLGKDTETIGYLKAAIKARPGSLPFHTQLAEFYLKYKRYEDAIAEWNAILKLLPRDSTATAEAYGKIASAYEAIGKADKAAEARAAAKSVVSQKR